MHHFDTVYLILPDGAVVVYYQGINTQVKVGYFEFDDEIADSQILFNHMSQCITRPTSISIVLSDLMVLKLNF